MAKTKLNIKVDINTMNQANTVFKKLGLDMSTGVNIFLHYVARNHGLPSSLLPDRADFIGEDTGQHEGSNGGVIQDSINPANSR